MRKAHFGLALLSLIICGCATEQASSDANVPMQTQSQRSVAPEWVYSPSKDGRLGGVGISSMHIKGKSAQRELAISRALDEIARQMGTKVSTVLKTSTSSTATSSSQTMDTYSFQTTDGQTVKATIQKFWADPASDDLYVWMLCDK